MLSVHTSPLDPPGGGDAGGMNVYIVETAKRLAARGIEVEIFTRATNSEQPPVVDWLPACIVRHVTAGPFEGLAKDDLPAQLCAFTAGVLRTEAFHEPGWYDLVHSHYWLSGQVGWLVRDRWGVPLVHSAHTLAKVKNTLLAEGDAPEPRARVIGEEQVVAEADRLIASPPTRRSSSSTSTAPTRLRCVPIAPGVDLERVRPGRPRAARAAHSASNRTRPTLLFVGRIQPLKAPDVLFARGRAAGPVSRPLQVASSARRAGRDWPTPTGSTDLARELGIADTCGSCHPRRADAVADYYRAADLTVVPSYNESFGLVALESQACGDAGRRRRGRRAARRRSPTTSPVCSSTATIPSSGRR